MKQKHATLKYISEMNAEFERASVPAGIVFLTTLGRMAAELNVTNALLKERQRLLDAIPQCPVHGPCVPYALEWIAEAKLAMKGKQ